MLHQLPPLDAPRHLASALACPACTPLCQTFCLSNRRISLFGFFSCTISPPSSLFLRLRNLVCLLSFEVFRRNTFYVGVLWEFFSFSLHVRTSPLVFKTHAPSFHALRRKVHAKRHFKILISHSWCRATGSIVILTSFVLPFIIAQFSQSALCRRATVCS